MCACFIYPQNTEYDDSFIFAVCMSPWIYPIDRALIFSDSLQSMLVSPYGTLGPYPFTVSYRG